jgi:hypothetical protein
MKTSLFSKSSSLKIVSSKILLSTQNLGQKLRKLDTCGYCPHSAATDLFYVNVSQENDKPLPFDGTDC